MYDLIYTNAEGVEQGALDGYVLTMTYGDVDNDFDIIFGTPSAPPLEGNCLLFCEGTEYGGLVRFKKTDTKEGTSGFTGSTWHGIMNDHVIYPPTGATHFKFKGDAHEFLRRVIAAIGLERWFTVAEGDCGITVDAEIRYKKAYDACASVLAKAKAKLGISWDRDHAVLSVHEAAVHDQMNSDNADFTITSGFRPVNHLLLLGKGEYLDRVTGDLYIDAEGNVSRKQCYFGLDEVMAIYEDTNSDEEGLYKKGTEKLIELQDVDEIDVSSELVDDYDVGDYVTVTNLEAGQTATAVVTSKTVTLANGEPTFSCEIGSASALFDLNKDR